MKLSYIFVISFDSTSDRTKNCISAVRAAIAGNGLQDVEIEIVKGVSPTDAQSTVLHEESLRLLNHAGILSDKGAKNCSAWDIALSLTHARLWAEVERRGISYCLVISDMFTPVEEADLSILEEIPSLYFDICHVSDTRPFAMQAIAGRPNPQPCNRNNIGQGLNAYILNGACINNLRSATFPLHGPLDVQLNVLNGAVFDQSGTDEETYLHDCYRKIKSAPQMGRQFIHQYSWKQLFTRMQELPNLTTPIGPIDKTEAEPPIDEFPLEELSAEELQPVATETGLIS